MCSSSSSSSCSSRDPAAGRSGRQEEPRTCPRAASRWTSRSNLYVYIYVCIYIYTYIRIIHTHTHTHTYVVQLHGMHVHAREGVLTQRYVRSPGISWCDRVCVRGVQLQVAGARLRQRHQRQSAAVARKVQCLRMTTIR